MMVATLDFHSTLHICFCHLGNSVPNELISIHPFSTASPVQGEGRVQPGQDVGSLQG